MRGVLPLDKGTTVQEAHRRIHEAIEQHENTIKLNLSTIMALESQIKELKACIIALNSQHNDYTPISRLPSEILCDIFSFAQRGESGDMLPYSEWAGLTHVSRFWREVSINSPSLWTELHSGNRRWLTEAVGRSQNAGLVFNIAGSSHEHWAGLNYALQYTSRIRGLRILDNPSLYVWKCIHSALTGFPPSLEFLDLNGVRSTQYPLTFQQLRTFDTPTNEELCNTVRQLRNLRLTNCYINWQSPSLFQPAVTHLTLLTIASRPTWRQFILAMRQMPDLESLILGAKSLIADQTADVPQWTPRDHIHFARLRVLDIFSQVSLEIEAFFTLITFPPSAEVNVDCFAGQRPCSTIFSRIITGVSRSYSTRLSESCFQTIVVFRRDCYGGRQTSLRFAFSKDTHSIHKLIYDEQEDANLQLEFYWETPSLGDSRLDVKPLLNTIFNSSLPLEHVRGIYLDLDAEDDGINAEILLTTFGKLPKVDTVVAGSHGSKPFIDAVGLSLAIQDTAPVTSDVPLYFPKLLSICFDGARITNSKSSPNPIAVPVELLQDCLIRRHKCCAKTLHFSFMACYGLGREETVYSLEESVLAAVQEAKEKKKEKPKEKGLPTSGFRAGVS